MENTLPNTSLLVMIRHGQSQYNLENRFTGNVDVELTDLGRQEAQKAGEQLRRFHFDVAYTSTLKRAEESLTIILAAIGETGISVYKDAALNERMYGDLQGLNKADILKQYGEEQFNLWRRSYAIQPPHGESLKDTEARALPYFTKEIEAQLSAGKNVLIVAHGNSLRTIIKNLEHISDEDIPHRELSTGVPEIYSFDRKTKTYNRQTLSIDPK
ncbi:MAG: 2,3-bisphosphoglycerate-dependent phosphoglycerate mutase [Cytophagaceae bacterium]|nr:2,3-bisphosphoglycerate-dependent phosphoglycerate mutase [Cytophagaceae bacterium]